MNRKRSASRAEVDARAEIVQFSRNLETQLVHDEEVHFLMHLVVGDQEVQTKSQRATKPYSVTELFSRLLGLAADFWAFLPTVVISHK